MDATGGSIALSPAAVGGRRRKLKLVTRKVARKALKKLGLKMRGGEDAKPADGAVAMPKDTLQAGGQAAAAEAAPAVPAAMGGAKRKSAKKTRRSASRRSSIFGL